MSKLFPKRIRATLLFCSVLTLIFITAVSATAAPNDDPPTQKDIVFRTIGSKKLMLDFFASKTPPPSTGSPLILSIHGGAWAYADRHNDLILRKLTRRGFALASIDYRVSGEAPYPAQIDDTRAAVQWLLEHAAEFHLDTNKFVATGISAGGHLALLLTLAQPPGDRTIKSVCALYGPSDLIELVPPKHRDDTTNAIALLLGGPVAQKLELARQASPITYVRKDSPPVLLYQGAKDKLVPESQSIKLDAALKAAGAQSTLVIYPDKGHAFGLDDKALADVADFYERSFK